MKESAFAGIVGVLTLLLLGTMAACYQYGPEQTGGYYGRFIGGFHAGVDSAASSKNVAVVRR